MEDAGEKKSRGENSGEVSKGMGEDKEKKSGRKWEERKKKVKIRKMKRETSIIKQIKKMSH